MGRHELPPLGPRDELPPHSLRSKVFTLDLQLVVLDQCHTPLALGQHGHLAVPVDLSGLVLLHEAICLVRQVEGQFLAPGDLALDPGGSEHVETGIRDGDENDWDVVDEKGAVQAEGEAL